MKKEQTRWCKQCNVKLRSGNPTDLCSSCLKKSHCCEICGKAAFATMGNVALCSDHYSLYKSPRHNGKKHNYGKSKKSIPGVAIREYQGGTFHSGEW